MAASLSSEFVGTIDGVLEADNLKVKASKNRMKGLKLAKKGVFAVPGK